MPKTPQPLSLHQQELINVVKAAHGNLAVARKVKTREIERRYDEARIEIERQLDELRMRILLQVEEEIVEHERALDASLIAAYSEGIPIKRIAQDGFGNRYPGAVQALLTKLRADGQVGSSEGYQRNTTDELDTETVVSFPKPIDVDGVLSEATTIDEPYFEMLRGTNGVYLNLVPESAPGAGDGVQVPAVVLTMDARDPYFKSIEKNARPGTPFRYATVATLYLHPATGELLVHESKEEGEILWDHPVARWVKTHPEEARAGFDAALDA